MFIIKAISRVFSDMLSIMFSLIIMAVGLYLIPGAIVFGMIGLFSEWTDYMDAIHENMSVVFGVVLFGLFLIFYKFIYEGTFAVYSYVSNFFE